MKKRILIVDDDPEILASTESFLGKRDYEVITATDGQKALATAREHHPDLILTDVLMPQMDGYVFYKELKNDNDLANIPVLIITGRGKMEETFKVAGVDGFIAKPFTPDELVVKLEDILRQTESGQAVPALQNALGRILKITHEEERLTKLVKHAKSIGVNPVAAHKDGDCDEQLLIDLITAAEQKLKDAK